MSDEVKTLSFQAQIRHLMIIEICPDKETKFLSITNSGIGMEKFHLVNNLGTTAWSGTRRSMQAIKEDAYISLIRHFGVRFFSASLVADSHHNDDDQSRCESEAGHDFSIRRDSAGEDVVRGATIERFLKEDLTEFREEKPLKELTKSYST
jgi:molecular chaperone HtpG